MITAASDSFSIQIRTAMFRLCMGCVLCGLFFEMNSVHAAQPLANPFPSGLDLISIKFAYSDIERHPANSAQQPINSLNARVGLFGTSEIASEPARFGGLSSLPDYINMEMVKDWVASIRWHMNTDDNRASMSPLLRVESKETLVEIKPLDRSVWMMWHRSLD